MVSTDCPLLRYGFRSRSDLLRGSYEYRYLSVDYNGDRSGYANGTFSTTKLGDMSLSVTIELEASTNILLVCIYLIVLFSSKPKTASR